ncbi:uncharacterized protein YecE (DUF72 family) [Mucilaginibacter yixingensis]|uniref:Uncharacterized protein YecE (DUF72 family) n=1 Tax=Mucilaginibacter yixingensis TaxID=1295612 RepID=A0A2T5JE88_9SPHI|nr:DUF72 domain-containing protein [Mucilaginibacter yixingensis]PTR00092.1 uncharacterized protein YecE (DUF72 family) [Mucilaginibacter yixingensis]
MENNYYSGTSNLVLPVKNKSFFPEAFQTGTRLTYYASLFNSIEINASFYRMPLARTVRKWSAEVPDNFQFTFKLHQSITHSLPGQFNLQAIPAFMEAINSTEKRGCLLVQLPPKFGPDIFQLNNLINALQPYNWRIAIEFRQPGWYTEEVYTLLRQFEVAMVIHDLHKSASPQHLTAAHTFLRFHGPEPNYRGSYDDAYLAEYAHYINDWLAAGQSVYAYFNNTLEAAVQNLQTLNRLLQLNQRSGQPQDGSARLTAPTCGSSGRHPNP